MSKKDKEKPIKFLRLTMQLVDTKINREVIDSAMVQLKKCKVEGPYASIKREHISHMELMTTCKPEDNP